MSPHTFLVSFELQCLAICAPFLDKQDTLLWIFEPRGRWNRLGLPVSEHLCIVHYYCHSFDEIPRDLPWSVLNFICIGLMSARVELVFQYWRWYLLNNWSSHEDLIWFTAGWCYPYCTQRTFEKRENLRAKWSRKFESHLWRRFLLSTDQC